MYWNNLFTICPHHQIMKSLSPGNLTFPFLCSRGPHLQEPSACFLNNALLLTLWYDMVAALVPRNQLG